MCERHGVRSWFNGLGIYAGCALVLCLIGVVAFTFELQSPDFAQWDGIKIHAVTQNGLTYWTYHGQKHVKDNTLASAGNSRPVPTTVYLNRSDPSDETKAVIADPWNRWSSFALGVGWFIAAAAVMVIGVVRRSLRRRRRIQTMGTYGAGISDEVVRRLLAERAPIRRIDVRDDD
jgi:hypothetical protein